MSNSVSPCSTWSTGSDTTKKPLFSFTDVFSDDGISRRSKNCKFCKENLTKITPNWFQRDQTLKELHTLTEECKSKLYTISDNIFGLYCTETVDHAIQLENIYGAISQIKKNRSACQIKIFCFNQICAGVSSFSHEIVTITIQLSQPPQLLKMLRLCEGIFDWLAKGDDNLAFLYSNSDETLLLTMTYAYSCYYDSLLRRDIRQSIAIKSFLNLHSKSLEKVPISYRRYAGYMSLYSCLNQLQSYRSSVNLYCLILYNFPAMESNKNKTSQLFFKIYTNEPLKCNHTTKLYCLPSNVNRLVILFDQYPIRLHGDTMIVCYHRSLIGSKRTKILRINFHTCQVTSDMITFYGQDFEDLYPGCPFKIKLELYFQATAVFGQGETNFVCDTSLSNLSQLERFDSYQSLLTVQAGRTHSSLSSDNENVSTSITIFKTKIESVKDQTLQNKKEEMKQHDNKIIINDNVVDKNIKVKDEEVKIIHNKEGVINDNGRITGPVDSYHSTKLETVRTSSKVLDGLGLKTSDNYQRKPLSMNNNDYRNYNEGEKCSEQLDTLMRDLNLGTTTSVNPATTTYPQRNYKLIQNERNIHTTASNTREVQLMSELLEAQKEISNLRRSMNHLDMVDHPRINNQTSKNNQFTRSHSLVKGSVTGYTSDTQSVEVPRSEIWSSQKKEKCNTSSNRTFPHLNQYVHQSYAKQDVITTEGRSTPSKYSAHRENMERERTMKEKYMTTEKTIHQNHQKDLESTDVLEEIETINLQPIGKGIQDLNKGNGQYKGNRTITPVGSYRYEQGSHNFINNLESVSPLPTRQNIQMSKMDNDSSNYPHNESFIQTNTSAFISENSKNITLQLVEDKIQWWYQPNLCRDEAVVILKYCKPGSFLIRDSNTYSGAYGLAVKVATIPQNIMLKSDDLDAEKVRHYLIEPMGSQGVCFKGFPDEPVFPSLRNLVLYYTHSLSVLPCLLVLPDKPLGETPKLTLNVTAENVIEISSPKIQSQFSNNKNGFSVYYLGCYDVEYITGPSVINKAIERLLADLDARKFTECQLRVNPNDGIVLTDMERKLFFRRHHAFANITYCAVDARDRKIELDVCKSKGVRKTKLFGLIVKNYIAGESKCFLFGELDPSQKATSIVKAICQNLEKPMQL